MLCTTYFNKKRLCLLFTECIHELYMILTINCYSKRDAMHSVGQQLNCWMLFWRTVKPG
jgi:hypothetical protein